METPLEGRLSQLEEELLQPHVRATPETAAKLLADEFVEFGSSGRIYNKPQTLDTLRSETAAEFAMSDFRVLSLAPGAALTTYRVSRFDRQSNRSTLSLRSSIWKMKDGRWQLVFHQGTPIE
jgi:hypothetical protein